MQSEIHTSETEGIAGIEGDRHFDAGGRRSGGTIQVVVPTQECPGHVVSSMDRFSIVGNTRCDHFAQHPQSLPKDHYFLVPFPCHSMSTRSCSRAETSPVRLAYLIYVHAFATLWPTACPVIYTFFSLLMLWACICLSGVLRRSKHPFKGIYIRAHADSLREIGRAHV